MAKITWAFQDEKGTNLNRYIATNVATGEEITFDLLRGGNISVVGTPLNAETLNSLIAAINELYDKDSDSDSDMSDLSDRISDLEGYNLGAITEEPQSAENSVLNSIKKTGIYTFTFAGIPYLLICKVNATILDGNTWDQLVIKGASSSVKDNSLVISTFFYRRKINNNGVFSYKITKTYNLGNHLYEHNIILSTTSSDFGDTTMYITILNNSPTELTSTTFMSYLPSKTGESMKITGSILKDGVTTPLIALYYAGNWLRLCTTTLKKDGDVPYNSGYNFNTIGAYKKFKDYVRQIY